MPNFEELDVAVDELEMCFCRDWWKLAKGFSEGRSNSRFLSSFCMDLEDFFEITNSWVDLSEKSTFFADLERRFGSVDES